MRRRSVATCLVVLMAFSSSAFGQDLRSSIERAVNAAAAQDPQPSSGRIPPGLLWTGIGLLGAGGLYLGLGAAEDPENETCVSGSSFDETCVSNRTALLTAGAVMAATGGVLLAIGVKKSHAPQVTFGPGRVSVQQPLPLDLGVRRLFGAAGSAIGR